MGLNRARPLGGVAIALATALVLEGCGSSEPLEETIDQSYAIESNASLRLTSIDGSIQIYGAHKPGLHLQAIKKAYTPERLKAIRVNIDQQLNSFTISTNFPPGKKWSFSDRSGTVDYIIVLPASCSVSRAGLRNGEILVAGMDTGDVEAKIENGRIFIRNCFGNVYASAATGALSLMYDWWIDRKASSKLEITDGNLFAVIPSDSSFRIHAEALNGKIGNDFSDQEERTGKTITRLDKLVGNSPDMEITLIAHDGNIKIVEANP